MTELAKCFYDGRTPTEQRVRQIFDTLAPPQPASDAGEPSERGGERRPVMGEISITLEQMLEGAQKMQRAFEVTLDEHAPKMWL